jgi:hypothetical protein
MGMLKEQVAKINSEPHTLARIDGANALVDWRLGPETDGVVLVNAQKRRAQEELMRLGVRDRDSSLYKTVGMFADKFRKEPPIPFVRRSAPLRRPIAVDEAIVETSGRFVPECS